MGEYQACMGQHLRWSWSARIACPIRCVPLRSESDHPRRCPLAIVRVQVAEDVMEAVAGTLKTAKKQKVVTYEAELLMQVGAATVTQLYYRLCRYRLCRYRLCY